jgi:hypothetical protein
MSAHVSDGLPRYQFFGGEGATCDTTVTHSRRPKRPQPKGKGAWGDESGRVESGTRSPKKWSRRKWYPLAEKVVPVLTETGTSRMREGVGKSDRRHRRPARPTGFGPGRNGSDDRPLGQCRTPPYSFTLRNYNILII